MDFCTMNNDDVLGDKIPGDQEAVFCQFCYQSLKLSGEVIDPQHFPGSHPISLDSISIFDEFRCDFLSRVNNVIISPYLMEIMVIDTLPSQQLIRRYLISDMMVLNKIPIVERPFYERWEMLEKAVIEPRKLEKRTQIYTTAMTRSHSRRKDFWPLSTVNKILKGFIPRLSHAADGLIIQGWDDPYVPRTHEGLLKWKYPEMNSVDFLFEIVDDRQSLYLNEQGKKKLMDGNMVVFPDGTDPATCAGKIVECSWDSEEDVWKCMRIRPDKGSPNEFNSYKKVMRSIRDNITKDVLLNEINEIIKLPMYADRIWSDSKVAAKPHPHHNNRPH